jgi:UBX domain-containing protein 1/4
MKEEQARKEQIKEAAKKRQEKQADIEAKKRIKAKIEADKEERRRKAEEAKAAREGRAMPSAPPVVAAPAASTSGPKQHNEARLRLQTAGGNVMKTLPAETTLFELAQMLQEENGLSVNRFILNFPKKTFEGSVDFGKTLQEAGLVPSAVVIVQ